MTVEHVPGKHVRDIMVYALSTCGWCRKTKEFLEQLGVEYDYEYVDLLKGDDRDKAIMIVRQWNPNSSFPTIVINDKDCIVGYKEDEIRSVLKL